MQHTITDEEADQFRIVVKAHDGGSREAYKAALLDFLNNRPESTLGKLRPIAEMPETVPEGCVRLRGTLYNDGVLGALTDRCHDMDTHAVDIFIQLPTPEAEERQRFEELFNVGQKLYLWGPKAPVWTGSRYELDLHENVWLGWKLAKAK